MAENKKVVDMKCSVVAEWLFAAYLHQEIYYNIFTHENNITKTSDNDTLVVDKNITYEGFVLPGGSRSSKTYSIIQFLVSYCFRNNGKRKNILIARQQYSDLKDSVMKDFFDILNLYGIYRDENHLKSNPQKYILYGNTISFSGLDTSGAHGKKYDVVWINEAFEAEKEAFDQLEMRLTEFFILDYNPCFTEHWILSSVITRPSVWLAPTSTQLNNPWLEQRIRTKILSYDPSNPENVINGTADDFMHAVYALGIGAQPQGIIFPYVDWINEFPDGLDYWYGQDFGFTCFDGSTLIETINGSMPIKDVRKGDLVLTRSGYRKVLNKFNNGYRKVIEKEINIGFDKIKFIATFNHNFNANNKWTKYGELTEKDKLYVLSSLMGTNTKGIQAGSTQTTIISSGKKVKPINTKYFISRFTSFIMGLSQKVKSYTTKMKIHSITVFQIWLLLLGLNTLKFMATSLNIMMSTAKSIAKRMVIVKIIGKKEDLSLSKHLALKKGYAIYAALNLRRLIHIKNAAINDVITHGKDIHQKITLKLNVKIAEKYFLEINTQNQERAVGNVQTACVEIVEIKTINRLVREVYDLEVEDTHEYFANGILVHNCDPSAIVKIAQNGLDVYLEKKLYTPTETSATLNEAMFAIGIEKYIPITADSSDKFVSAKYGAQEMVKDLQKYGWNIQKASKKGNKVDWIRKLKEYHLHIVISPEFKKEQQSYRWRTVNGIQINEPIDKFDHLWTATFYGLILKQIRRSRFRNSD